MFGMSVSAVIAIIAGCVLLICMTVIVICIKAYKKRVKREEEMKQREIDLINALSNPIAGRGEKTIKTIIPARKILITRCDIPNQSSGRYILGDRIRIGRNDEYNNLIIAEETVSSRHCEIFERDKEFWIIDIQSSNQTVIFRRGECIVVDSRDGMALENGDRIRLGNVELLISFSIE